MAANATAQAADDIRDIKPPVTIANGWQWLLWTLGGLAILALLWLAWRAWRRRGARAAVVPTVPAHVRARQSLEEALALIGQPKPFCFKVSDTIRAYLEGRFAFRAPERTTVEFLRELSATDLLSVAQKHSLGVFLESCDLVKFAKYEPSEPELRGLHAAAMKLVAETEPREPAESAAPAAGTP